uniref:C2H2-type domain-containing protein n=1 Tax=Lygus hesperus TaxID=30085 RepID=A0A0K8SI28_LYGHE
MANVVHKTPASEVCDAATSIPDTEGTQDECDSPEPVSNTLDEDSDDEPVLNVQFDAATGCLEEVDSDEEASGDGEIQESPGAYRSTMSGRAKKHNKTHAEGKPYGCVMCDFKASRLDHLNRHMRIHTGEKPYACEKCDYRASRSGQLTRHMRTHKDEKPYNCDSCDYRASSLGELKNHEKTHKEKSYWCDYKAKHLGNLKTHERIHTGEKPYSCEMCDYRASQLVTLTRHVRTHTEENLTPAASVTTEHLNWVT